MPPCLQTLPRAGGALPPTSVPWLWLSDPDLILQRGAGVVLVASLKQKY